MTVIDGAKEWLLRVCIKRGVKGAVIALSSFITTHGLAKVLEAHGVVIDWTKFEAGSFVSICGALEMLHDYLKVKKGLSWL